MSKKRLGLLALSLLLGVAGYGLFHHYGFRAGPEPTALADFSAPFVFGRFEVPEHNPLTEEAVALGRRLFYDPRLSANNQVSCASCHEQSRAFTDSRGVSTGVSRKPLEFNSMSLVNLMWGPQRFFWNGRSESLEHQALLPIQHADEMGNNIDRLLSELRRDKVYRDLFAQAYGRVTEEHLAMALAAFQRTLISANSKYDQYLRGESRLTEQEEWGRKLFMAHPDVKASLRGGNCIDCHSQFLTSGFRDAYDGFANNGLDEEPHLKPGLSVVTGQAAHKGLFKVPTLRNIELTAPYMHDGRFATLEEVLDHYNHNIKPSSTLSPLILEASNRQAEPVKQAESVKESYDVQLSLSDDEQQAIIAFLKTLTDWTFIENPAFSNPFTSEIEPVNTDDS